MASFGNPQDIVLALVLVAPGFIATFTAVSLSAIEREISNTRLIILSIVSSAIVDSAFLALIQSIGEEVNSPSAISQIFFSPNFNVAYVGLLLGLSALLGLLFSVSVIKNHHGQVRDFLWEKFSHKSGRKRHRRQPWEGLLSNAHSIRALTEDGLVAGEVLEYSRAGKEKQLAIHEPEWYVNGDWKSANTHAMLLTDDNIKRLEVWETPEEHELGVRKNNDGGGRIVKTPDVLDGKPRVEGRRIGVYFLHERVEGRGLSPQTVADRHDLDVADVYRALAYFHEHPAEMAAIREERERRLDEAKDDPNVVTGPGDVAE